VDVTAIHKKIKMASQIHMVYSEVISNPRFKLKNKTLYLIKANPAKGANTNLYPK
jgi:hypothetical protein